MLKEGGEKEGWRDEEGVGGGGRTDKRASK